MFYLSSVLITFIVNYVTDAIIKKKIIDSGEIYKGKKVTKKNLIFGIIMNFIPYLNLLISLLTILLIVLIVKNEEIFSMSTSKIRKSPQDVKNIFERQNKSEQMLIESMILDGADDDTISKEMELIKNEVPFYTEQEYNFACAQHQANQMLSEIEWNVELDDKEKIELLSSFRKVYLDELNGKNKENLKPIKKTLKLVNSKR